MEIPENLELTCFQLITQSGTAKSSYVEAIQKAKEGKFDEAEECIQLGDKYYAEGHSFHQDLAQMEEESDKSIAYLLLVHAEDQMMSCETIRIIAVETIELYKKLGSN